MRACIPSPHTSCLDCFAIPRKVAHQYCCVTQFSMFCTDMLHTQCICGIAQGEIQLGEARLQHNKRRMERRTIMACGREAQCTHFSTMYRLKHTCAKSRSCKFLLHSHSVLTGFHLGYPDFKGRLCVCKVQL